MLIFMEALKIYRRLASANPEAYEPDVAGTLNNLAILQVHLSRYAEAEQNFMEALEIYERLEERYSGLYADKIKEIIETLQNLKQL